MEDIYQDRYLKIKMQETKYKPQDTRWKIDTKIDTKKLRYKIQNTGYKIQDWR